jgi:hypothetical protein
MAKSRLALFVLATAAASPAMAEPLTAEQAIQKQRENLVRGAGLECPRDGNDVVVCGRREREVLPFDRTGEPTNRMPGETMSTRQALDNTRLSTCTTTGPNQSCGGGLPVLQILFTALKVAKHLIDPEE